MRLILVFGVAHVIQGCNWSCGPEKTSNESELLEGLKKRRWFFSKVERITETTVRKTGQLGIKQDAYLVVGREKKQVLTVVMVMVCSSRIML